MNKSVPLFFCLLLGAIVAFGQPDIRDRVLQADLEDLLGDFEGDAGIYVYNLEKHSYAGVNENKIYPTASMIKVPILLTIFSKIESGELSYNQKLVYKDSLYYAGDDLLGSFKDGEEILLSKIIMLMITMSDNTASLWCQQLAGSGTAINAWLKDAGLKKTRMNSRTPGREKDWEKYGWGQTSPKEMASLVKMIGEGNAISKAASEEMNRVMGNIYWTSEALSMIPPNVRTASKQGAVSNSRSEVVFVNAPSGDYVFCVITNNQADTSWQHENAGYQLIRDVSGMIWQHFEPKNPYEPAPGNGKWFK